MDLALLFLRIAAAAVQVVGKGGFDDPEVVERAAGEGWSEAKGAFRVLSVRVMYLLFSVWEARRNPQTVLRSHFTWCDDGQEILASEERGAGLVWVAHPSVRLSCFFFARDENHPLELGTAASLSSEEV